MIPTLALKSEQILSLVLYWIMLCTTCPFRKDPHGFFSFPVTDAIAPGYSMIIKHPMDFSTMKDKIMNNDYNTVTEFKVRRVFNTRRKLGCWICICIILCKKVPAKQVCFNTCSNNVLPSGGLQTDVWQRHGVQSTRDRLLQGCQEAAPHRIQDDEQGNVVKGTMQTD